MAYVTSQQAKEISNKFATIDVKLNISFGGRVEVSDEHRKKLKELKINDVETLRLPLISPDSMHDFCHKENHTKKMLDVFNTTNIIKAYDIVFDYLSQYIHYDK